MSQRCRHVILCAAGIKPPGGPKCLISQPRSPSLSGSGSCKFDGETAKTPLKPDPRPLESKEPERWSDEAGLAHLPMRKGRRSAESTFAANCDGFSIRGGKKKCERGLRLIPTMREMAFSGCQTSREGVKEGEFWQDSDMGNWSQPRHNMLI